jgi:hypothetical protein
MTTASSSSGSGFGSGSFSTSSSDPMPLYNAFPTFLCSPYPLDADPLLGLVGDPILQWFEYPVVRKSRIRRATNRGAPVYADADTEVMQYIRYIELYLLLWFNSLKNQKKERPINDGHKKRCHRN